MSSQKRNSLSVSEPVSFTAKKITLVFLFCYGHWGCLSLRCHELYSGLLLSGKVQGELIARKNLIVFFYLM